ncbi:ABC transporter ATP-binding protein [Teredinibacter purpureus]|uniref:ABC transporter ATP-binding protein n=1 Tax=Teredinibacter purpureus TaxID=2731756 RepID=UPI0006990327|nr:ATP-binding cassette domain-containing protein [Teredinibacter purpureus]
MTPTNQPIIELNKCTVLRNGRSILSDVTITFESGMHTAILGPNGAGKSTLLKLLTREFMPLVSDESYCHHFGEPRIPIGILRKKFGVISNDFQNEYRTLATGREVVLSAFFGSIGLHTHHHITPNMRRLASKALSNLGITHLAERQYLQLSTGEQRRLLLARATVHTPEVLILDEPTNGLDLNASSQVLRDMRTLAQTGITLILVTHHLHEIIPEIEQLIFLKTGKIIAKGDTKTLLTSDKISELYGIGLDVIEKNGFYQAYPR